MSTDTSTPRGDPYRDGYGRIRTQGQAPKPFLRPALERVEQIILGRIRPASMDSERRGPRS